MSTLDPLDEALSAGSLHPQEARNDTPKRMFKEAREASLAAATVAHLNQAINSQAHRFGIPANRDITLRCSVCGTVLTAIPQGGRYLQLKGNPSCQSCSHTVLDPEAVLHTGTLWKIPDFAVASMEFATPTAPTEDELWRLLIPDSNLSMPVEERISSLTAHLAMVDSSNLLVAPSAVLRLIEGVTSSDDEDEDDWDDEGEEWKRT